MPVEVNVDISTFFNITGLVIRKKIAILLERPHFLE